MESGMLVRISPAPVINRTRALSATFVPKPLTGNVLQAFISGAALKIASDETGDSDVGKGIP
jgi:hypothetical protein